MRESGIFRTKRSRPVSVSTLTRMLVPKPKKAFQSPGTTSFALLSAIIAACTISTPSERDCRRHADPTGRLRDCLDQRRRLADPAENATLGLDHPQPDGMKFREVGAAAILQHEAVIAAVIGLAHRRVDADLRRDAGHHQLPYAAMPQGGARGGGEECALAGLVNDRLPTVEGELRV